MENRYDGHSRTYLIKLIRNKGFLNVKKMDYKELIINLEEYDRKQTENYELKIKLP